MKELVKSVSGAWLQQRWYYPILLTILSSATAGGAGYALVNGVQRTKKLCEPEAFTITRKINSLLLHPSDATGVLQKIADFLPSELAFATGVVVLYEKDTQLLRRVAASNTKEAQTAIQELSIPFTQIAIPLSDPHNLLARALREKQEFVTERVFDVFVPALTEAEAAHIQLVMGTQATLVYPIFLDEEPLGVFLASTKKTIRQVTASEKNLIRLFVDGAGIALHTTQLLSSLAQTTERLQLAIKEAGLAGKVKTDLLTMASHEFRTPLTIMTNALWFLNKDEVKSKLAPKEVQNVERIVAQMERLNYLVQNLTQMLTTTSGDLTLHLAPVQLEIILREVLVNKKTEIEEKRLSVTYTEPDNLLPPLSADKTKLQYVIWELLTNAIKYTPALGNITISIEQSPTRLTMQITNTGAAIAQAEIASLFDGFHKIDPFHTTAAGMGLGLSIVKKIMDLHKGSIAIVSTEGTGTTVTLTLPLPEQTQAVDGKADREG